jgi:murein DD-endopeptidase MepM/ murein hydrolase activator NlpD
MSRQGDGESRVGRPRCGWVAIPGVVAVVGILLLHGTASWSEAITVSPGSLVRWPGEEIEKCGQGERSWEPLIGECWYPIDLLAPEGEISVVRWREGRREERSLRVGSYPYEVQHITLKDDSQVNLSAENLKRVQRENGMISALWGRESSRLFDLPLGPPLESLPEGGRFGSRRFFNDQPRSPHTGSDFAAESGMPILSVAAGTIALAGDFFFPGKSVFVDHGDGLISMYFHMSGIAVEEGDVVQRGEILGLVGQTGRTTGPHLHFGVRWHGARVDPAILLGSPDALPSISQ